MSQTNSCTKYVKLSPVLILSWIIVIMHAANVTAFSSIDHKVMTKRSEFGRDDGSMNRRLVSCSSHVALRSNDFSEHYKRTRLTSSGNCSISKSVRKNTGRCRAVSSIIIAALIKPAAAMASSITTTEGIDLANSYHLSRIFFLRLLAVVYISAFSVAKNQNKGLVGDRGITPAKKILDKAEERGAIKSRQRKEWIKQRDQYSRSNHLLSRLITRCKTQLSDSNLMTMFRDKFWYRTDTMDRPLPTLLWFADRSKLNTWMDSLAIVGLFLASIMLATGSANTLLILGLWIIQRSLMAVGGVWYGYGWEPQLAELTFHALFLVPLLSMDPFFGFNGANGPYPVPMPVLWAVRFYLFKIMLGAGLIKVKSSDQKWKPGNMSAMYHFYETQPVPNPFTRYFHFMPKAWHRFEAWSNHFVELMAPFMLLMPFREWRVAGGLIQITFQLVLIFSGNLSFLNWLIIVPAILCLDDKFLSHNLPPLLQAVAFGATQTQAYLDAVTSKMIALKALPASRHIISIAFVLLMAKLNMPVIRNLLARRQVMNGSFDKLRLANTYGAFGTVAEQRIELIIKSACNINGPWKEYQFKVKPGDVCRSPSWISPYHHRLDWQMWIASQLGRVERSPWMYSFLLKLLNQETDVMKLLKTDPWMSNSNNDAVRPKYIRIEKYKYNFCSRKAPDKSQFWSRERVGSFFPHQGVMTTETLNDIVDRGA